VTDGPFGGALRRLPYETGARAAEWQRWEFVHSDKKATAQKYLIRRTMLLRCDMGPQKQELRVAANKNIQ
jgi:hypothetical protein